MTAATREQHLLDLAKKHNVYLELRELRDYDAFDVPHGWARYGDSSAEVVGWRGDQISYFLGLHEIGHHAMGHARRRHKLGKVEAEAEAWAWALDHTAEAPNGATIDWLWGPDCFGSYLRIHGLSRAGSAYSDLVARTSVRWAPELS